MKTRKSFRKGIFYAVLIVLGYACTQEELIDLPRENDTLSLSASKKDAIVKATTTNFEVGTLYSIYAMIEGSTDWKQSIWKPNPKACTEADDNTINYGDAVSLGMKNVDFYGVTYDSKTKTINATDYISSDPTKIKIMPDNGTNKFGDLMYSNNLKSRNSSDGILQMNFKHVMSKIQFTIYKDEKKFSPEKRIFDKAKLTYIKIKTSGGAVFNVLDGTWSDREAQKTIAHLTNASLLLENSAQNIPGETLFIPNDEAVQITVELTDVKNLKTGTLITPEPITYTVPNKDTGTSFFKFLANHQYTLSIAVFQEMGEIIIAFDPTVESWKDKNIDVGET